MLLCLYLVHLQLILSVKKLSLKPQAPVNISCKHIVLLSEHIAQGLLEVAKTDMDKVTAAVESCREQRQDIDSKRQKMLDNYIYKQRSSVNSSMTRDKSGQKEK